MKYLLTLILLLTPCITTGAEYRNALPEPIPGISHVIETTAITEGKEIGMTGNSFHIGNGYILTCNHCIEFPKYESVLIRSVGYIHIKKDYTSYKYTINDNPVELIGVEEDIALLYDKSMIGQPNINFGDSDKLEIGTTLILVGNSSMEGMNVKIGIVSRLRIDKSVLGLGEDTADNTFISTTPTFYGDSGGALLAYSENYYVVGMVYAKEKDNASYGFVFKSNYLQEVIGKLMKDTLWNNRE